MEKNNFYVSPYEEDNDWSITTRPTITICDYGVATSFGIDLKEYQKTLKKFGAYKFKGNYWFKLKEDAEKCVKYLRSVYVKE